MRLAQSGVRLRQEGRHDGLAAARGRSCRSARVGDVPAVSGTEAGAGRRRDARQADFGISGSNIEEPAAPHPRSPVLLAISRRKPGRRRPAIMRLVARIPTARPRHAAPGATAALTARTDRGILRGPGRMRTWPASDACVRLDQPQQVGLQQVTGHLEPAARMQHLLAGRSSRCGPGCTPRRCPPALPGDDLPRRVLAEGLVPRANEQAADMAAVINLARAVQWCGCSCCDNRTATIVRKLVGRRAATQAGRPGHTARTHGRPRSPS